MATNTLGANLVNFGYTYDAAGDLHIQTDAGVATTYGYDAQNRLTSVSGPSTQTLIRLGRCNS